jgi:plastocyanin
MIWAWRIFFEDRLPHGRGSVGRGSVGRGSVGRGSVGRGSVGRGSVGRGSVGGGSVTAVAFLSRARQQAVFGLLAILFGTPLVGGSVRGRVELKDSHFASVRKGQDYSGVVVWLLPVDGAPAARADGKHARLIQKDKTFTPHVLAIETGTTVDFPNYDPIFHNAFSNFSGQLFDIGLYAPGSSRSFRFQRSGAVRIFCNIHPAMSAVILVVDTPYFAVTGRDGDFEIAGVTPGEYQLNVFHERASEAVLQGLERRVALGPENLPLPPMTISESGYLPEPHKNKYGKDYPKTVEDGVFYPGAPK